MIYYFSGTGNSRYVAERIAAVTDEELVCINKKIKNGESANDSGKRIFVTPTYAWRIPKIVEKWIAGSEFSGGEAWFVMTCGGEIGNAARYNKQLCEKKDFSYMGTMQIRMPENYIAMFHAPEPEEAGEIVEKAEPDIQKAGEIIRDGETFPLPRNNLYDRAVSGLVNGPFYKLFVKADAFYAKDSCIGCGECVVRCPLNNLSLKDGKPVWGKNCTHCMACICSCPQEAIEYGKKSVGKPRYRCGK